MFNRKEITEIRQQATGKVGAIFSCWDLLHAGHCLILEFAKSHCDYLVAGLHVDPRVNQPWKNAPIMSLEERRILIQSNKYVDYVIEYESEQDHYDILVDLKPDMRFFGSDYLRRETYTGKDLEIPVVYHDRDHHGWSSSSLRQRIWQAENQRICGGETCN